MLPPLRTTLIFLVLVLIQTALPAQDRSNPFEITTRLPTAAGMAGTEKPPAGRPNYSPFDVRPEATNAPLLPNLLAPATAPPPGATGLSQSGPLVIQSTDPNKGKGSILAIQLLLLVAMASLWVLFGGLLRQCIRGTVNDSLMNQIYTRRSGGEETALWICYLFFFLVAGFFLYLFAVSQSISLNRGIWSSWLTYALIVAGAVGLKQWIIWVLGRLFPVRKEISRYAFVLMVFSILAGLVLVPINLGTSYAPEALRPWFLYGGLAVGALIYLFHLARGLLIAAPLVGARPVHIILYICTVEIAPLLLLYRYLSNTLV
ncbi:DUF4271 domain-containing protein [Neolewinella antarctica]|uniref:DUF4271 domain-containing protein n=1 Tax=Neolewinella antarctica TaxID=442734 RepID=A0ABX0XED5_9BACT|nr:DUF4271 domain-containing protein [Neolewinella antarctica]NJC27670.1 hypothetical protein [Neolewinella antarctica]